MAGDLLEFPGQPGGPGTLPPNQLQALSDLTVLMQGYERLDYQAGLQDRRRSMAERAHHLARLIEIFRGSLEQRRPSRPLLVAIAAQAITWAATLDDPDDD